jgi:hypothetical protein
MRPLVYRSYFLLPGFQSKVSAFVLRHNKSLHAGGGSVKSRPPATAGGTDKLVRRCLNEIAPPRQLLHPSATLRSTWR